jgi:NAD(P) transhydrogenase subunit alpha
VNTGFVGDLTVFVLAILVGFEVISKVPATLHTPLMSGANSIHGVVFVGVVILSSFVDSPLGYVLTFIASAAFAAANVVGLRGHRPDAADVSQAADAGARRGRRLMCERTSRTRGARLPEQAM